ncbi:hypothetical protein [Micromonospora eburnea]|uniref:Uncharacterized protein n=1 Tax=Micromonospora eburnea TaxID=227316 RepID=A0A1C6TQU7_9ACTN|nr:hypothetical protein [Micromonospora eburnea]SCL43797.1 hypothetical protein GA0070604_0011 [Micromonospora eburnea]SCL44011.1 hypothetical protein GA0070604_0143 [Micromonospora eburnea]
MNPRFMWAAVVLAGLAVAAAAVMAIAGVSTDTIVVVMSLLVVPVLTAMVAAQVADVKSTTSQVAQQTNGNVTRLMEIIAEQSRQLAASKPVTPDPAPGQSNTRTELP